MGRKAGLDSDYCRPGECTGREIARGCVVAFTGFPRVVLGALLSVSSLAFSLAAPFFSSIDSASPSFLCLSFS